MRGACGFEIGIGFLNGFGDLTQDELTGLLCLLKRLRHDLGCDALDLDIHLQGGNALAPSRLL